MAVQEFHKEAINNLINSLMSSINTPTSLLCRAKTSKEKIDLSTVNKLGLLVIKFEQVFGGAANNNNNNNNSNGDDDDDETGEEKVNYEFQITNLVNYIEGSELFNLDDIEIIETQNFLEQQQITFQHIHALLLVIRRWLCRFYLDKNFIISHFPSIHLPGETLTLGNIKEYNLCIISLLIFQILYIFRHSFPEYQKLLEFSKICFTELDDYLALATLDREFVGKLLQTTLADARLEEQSDAQVNSGLIKQIDTLRNKICNQKQQRIPQDKTGSKATPKMSTPRSKAKRTTASSSNNNNDEPKPFVCPTCAKSFPTSYKLNRHCYSHTGERPYVCNWANCMKRFNDNYHLRRHVNTHTGEKPFTCKAIGCTKRYSRAEDLRNHQKTHYGNGRPASVASASAVGGGGGHGVNNALPATPSHNHHLSDDIQALVQQQQQNAATSSSLIEQHLVQSQLNQQIQLQSQVVAVVAANNQQQQQLQQQQQPRPTQFTNQGMGDDPVLQSPIILQGQLSPRPDNNNNQQLHLGDMIF